MNKNDNGLLFKIFNYTLFTLFGIICIYPFYYLFIQSLSDPVRAAQQGNYFLPVGWTLDNYIRIFHLPNLLDSFLTSTARAVIGTFITLYFTSMFAYVLIKQELFLRKFIYRMTIVTMYLSAGLIPWYLTMKSLGLQNSFLLYVLPSAVNAFFLVLIKTYIEQIPPGIEESAYIDGAGYYTIFMKIIIPMSVPILAAVAVFSAVGQWNTWTDNFFLVSNNHLQTMQLTLLNFLRESEALAMGSNIDMNNIKMKKLSPAAVRITVSMVATIPILLVYPFLQKYFVKGIMLGAVKG
jgi:putative aldouronate transport system permease protein